MNTAPFLLRLVAASLTVRQNQMLIAEVAHLRMEIAYLREQLPQAHHFAFTDPWRLRLTILIFHI